MKTKKSKLDYLKKYLSGKSTGTKKQRRKHKKMIRINDLEQETYAHHQIEEEEDDGPVLVETDILIPASLKSKFMNQLKNNKTVVIKKKSVAKKKGKWETVQTQQNQEQNGQNKQNKQQKSDSVSSSSSEEDPGKRKRYDSDSDEKSEEDEETRRKKMVKREKQIIKEIKGAMAMTTSEEDSESEASVKRKEESEGEVKQGLFTIEELKEQENKQKMDYINKMASKYKDLQPVIRDRQGVRINASFKSKAEELKKMQEAQLKKFSGGIKQKQERKARKEAYEKSKNEGFARYEYGADQEKEMIGKMWFNDPMAKVLKKKKNDKIKKISIKLGKLCKYTAPPNRFEIKAGHRWDGVDRGNGYERRYLEKQNRKKDLKQISQQINKSQL